MNRKLVNGLLLLAIASFGCSTFTSCKDTDEDYKNEILLDQQQLRKDLLALIESMRCKYPDACKALEEYLDIYGPVNNPDDPNDPNYNPKIKYDVAAAIAKQVNILIEQWMNENPDDTYYTYAKARESYEKFIKDYPTLTSVDITKAFLDLQTYLGSVVDRINSMITSIEVSQTYNHIFGTLNLPIGLQSNVAANYIGYTGNAIDFPSFEEEFANAPEATMTTSVSGNYGGNPEEEGVDLGYIYTTLNAQQDASKGVTVSLDGFSLVKSNGEVAPVKLVPADGSEDELKFGYTRADDETPAANTVTSKNGLFKLAVTAEATDEATDALKINIHTGLVKSFKDILKNRQTGDLVTLSKNILSQMDGFLPAYGIKYTWTVKTNPTDLDSKKNYFGSNSFINNTDADGTEATYAIYSKYEIAATMFQPLGYEFLEGESLTDRKLPTFGRVENVINDLFNEIGNEIDIKLGISLNKDEIVKNINITVEFGEFSVGATEIKIHVNGGKVTSTDGTNTVIGEYPGQDIVLQYTPGVGVDGTYATALNPLIKDITDAVNKWIKGEGDDETKSISEQITASVQDAIGDMVEEINRQLEGVDSNINQQIQDILANIKNKLNGKAGTADRFVNLYNKLAGKINKVLADPNGLLQPMACAVGADNDLHILSGNVNDPTIFKAAGGDAVSVYVTSYTADLIAPSYRKWVGVTKVGDATLLQEENIEGRQNEIALKALPAGSYRLIYSSLDYHGTERTRIYYFNVK